MLRTIQHQLFFPARRIRWYSQVSAVTRTAPTVAGSQPGVDGPAAVRYPYFVPRNTRGSIPVYTDIRNHNKFLTLIRNVEGNVDALAADLAVSLAKPGSAERLKVTTVRGRHIVLSGGNNWKRDVVQWLKAKGF